MSLPEREDSLSELNKRLYDRNAEALRVRHSSLSPQKNDAKTSWGIRQMTNVTTPRRPELWTVSFLTKLFVGAIVFLGLSLLLAAFFLFRGSNVISNANIDIAVTGPLSIKSGDNFDLGIAITNKNRSDLETADLIIAYPVGTRDPKDPKKEMLRTRESLGVVKSGSTLVHGARAILFGPEKSKPVVTINLEYRLRGSDAIFEKQKTFEVQIADAPISVNLNLPPEVNAGKEIAATVEILSNSPTILKDVGLLALWPPGFRLISAGNGEAADNGATLWRLGDLAPGSKRSFAVRGVLDGQDEELKSFRFQVGVLANRETTDLSAVYTDIFKNIAITKPFVGLLLTLDGESKAEYVGKLGEPVRAQVTWGNNLPVDVVDGVLSASFRGTILNQASVATEEGFYSSGNNLITWDQASVPAFKLLKPGDRDDLQFSFASNLLAPNATMRNPAIYLTMLFRGKQNRAGQFAEPVETKVERVIKLEAPFNLAAKSLYYEGPFTNTGPIPPKVEQETTYTISWVVGTAGNDVKDIKVRAILPPYGRWLSTINPSTEKVSYNETTREILWEGGFLQAGPQGEARTRQVAFQIGITPSVSQAGDAISILDSISASGIDTFTGTLVEKFLGFLDSDFSTDPGFRANDDRVIP